MNDTRLSYEESVNEALSRYSVQDLVEQTPEAMNAAAMKYDTAAESLIVLDQGEAGVIRWWRILSGSNVYEVRRFKNFVYCSCQGFFYRHKVCKHVAISVGVRCWECFLLSANGGRLCPGCESKAHVYMPPAPQSFSVTTI